jgi:hypothetical protein
MTTPVQNERFRVGAWSGLGFAVLFLVGAVASNVATMVVGEVGLHFGGSVRRSGIDLGDGGVSADGVSHDAVSWPVSVKSQTVKPRKDVSC